MRRHLLKEGGRGMLCGAGEAAPGLWGGDRTAAANVRAGDRAGRRVFLVLYARGVRARWVQYKAFRGGGSRSGKKAVAVGAVYRAAGNGFNLGEKATGAFREGDVAHCATYGAKGAGGAEAEGGI